MNSELMRALANGGQESAPKQTPDMQARRLVDSFKDLQKQHSFSPGDLVEKKPGIGGGIRYPEPGYPAVVTEVIDPPLRDDEHGLNSSMFGVGLDLRIMAIVDGEAVAFVVPSHIFQPYSGEIA